MTNFRNSVTIAERTNFSSATLSTRIDKRDKNTMLVPEKRDP